MASAPAAHPKQPFLFCRINRTQLAILGLLWDAAEPRTVRQVFEELYSREPWSYNTVQTTLWDLVRGGVLKQTHRKGRRLFLPAIGREHAAAACVQEVITGILGGKLSDGVASVLKHLSLSPADRRAIRKST